MNLFQFSAQYIKRISRTVQHYLNFLHIRFYHNSKKVQVNLRALDIIQSLDFQSRIETSFHIFGRAIDLKTIKWSTDYETGFQFPKDFFFNIRINDYINSGNDIKWPWELSRFYFAPLLAHQQTISDRKKKYQEFKNLFKNWEKNNPVCKGVNWQISMEVAIRAVNIVVASNLFLKDIEADQEFRQNLKKALVQHAKYIYTYPELFGGNHTTSNYAGLFFLAVTLKNHPDSDKWLQVAVDGLEKCIRSQTLDDGVNFEASISYHRLVLEMFSLSALVATSNNISLTDSYFQKLFRMFEYTASYIDQNGNAPQVGDNDSGRFLWFNDDEHNHNYLLEIGNRIFNYDFKKLENTDKKSLTKFIEFNITPRNASELSIFKNGETCILKNRNFSLIVTYSPIDSKVKSGHKHIDDGSFTLSINGVPIVVDPGTYCYTKNISIRNQLRNYSAHNVLISENFTDMNLNNQGLWSLTNDMVSRVVDFKENHLKIQIFNRKTKGIAQREFILEDDRLIVHDFHEGFFKSQMNLNEAFSTKHFGKKVVLNSKYVISSTAVFNQCEKKYSFGYGQLTKNKNVFQLTAKDEIKTIFEILEVV